MSETLPQVAIIVVNYNTPDLVAKLVDSIKQHTFHVEYEIIVINNGCNQGGHFASGKSTFVRTIESPTNLGFAAAANRAAHGCQQPLLLFANSDCLLNGNVIAKMIKFLVDNPDVAACSPRTIFPDGITHSSIRHFPTYQNLRGSRGAFFRTRNDYTIEADETRKPVEAMAATFMMIRRTDFEAIAGFDERYFMYVEDTDMCKRLFDLGRKTYFLGDITVTHHWGASSKQRPVWLKYHHHLSMWKYFQKHHPQNRAANLWLGVQLTTNFLLVVLKTTALRLKFRQ